jgi:type II secretory pathway component GspD/PulD (secretin)
LRASQGEAATFRVGDRIPVLTGSFTSILSALPGGQSVAGRGLSPIVPSFNYEDLGITLKATPQVGADSMVTMQLDMAIKALGGATINDIPTISNRQYVGTITVRDGETSVLAGTVDRSETKGLSGIPWLSSLPGFGKAFGSTNTSSTSDQLLLLVTPHVLQLKPRPDLKTEMYMDGN